MTGRHRRPQPSLFHDALLERLGGRAALSEREELLALRAAELAAQESSPAPRPGRSARTTAQILVDAIAFLRDRPGASTRQIRANVRGRHESVAAALEAGRASGVLRCEKHPHDRSSGSRSPRNRESRRRPMEEARESAKRAEGRPEARNTCPATN